MWRKWRVRLGMVLLSLLVVACAPQLDGEAWYGYYYDNVTLNTEGAMSRPFVSARECHAVMRDLLSHSPKLAGYACARDCPAPIQGVIADCVQVAH